MMKSQFYKILALASFLDCTSINAHQWIYGTLEALYWQPHEEGLTYAIKTNATVNGDVNLSHTDTIDSKVKEVDGDWNPGFRVGIGYHQPNRESWDIYLNWTYFFNHSHDSVHVNDFDIDQILITDMGQAGEWIVPIWLTTFSGEGTIGPNASASWRLNYNTLDLEIGRDCCLGVDFSIRPHFGLRAASIYQKLHVKYSLINISQPVVGQYFPGVIKEKNDFLGGGIRIGTNMMWNFNNHWGLFGKISGSLIYGKFDLKERGEEFIGVSLFSKTSNDFHSVQPNVELGIGLSWGSNLGHKEQHRLSFAIAYEFVEWFNQNQFFVIGSSVPNSVITTIASYRGNLNMQGATLNMRFDY